MRKAQFPSAFKLLAICAVVALWNAPVAQATTETVLYTFPANGLSGALPVSRLISDTAGNLYGTTELGGASGQGTVFELSPGTGGDLDRKRPLQLQRQVFQRWRSP